MALTVEASAPSNIALIKYMGKSGAPGNLPINPSLSYTLDHLRSYVTLTEADLDDWGPLAGFANFSLSDHGRKKFLAHLSLLRQRLRLRGNFFVRSANDFPSDCGLASSASSFAALTMAAHEMARAQGTGVALGIGDLSAVSRLGSGSSCRSFLSPWVVWDGEGVAPVDVDWPLHHAVILVEEGPKAVSSSEAHQRVATSELFHGRPERARQRLEGVLAALSSRDWSALCEWCWREFWDMHALFETARPPFGYMTAGTMAVLTEARGIWRDEGDGPLVTMDAGANVHILYRTDQVTRMTTWLSRHNHLADSGRST